jgi:hypothetical protein
MPRQDDLDFHRSRAGEELNRGLTAEHIIAARTHLALASMHMQRVRELDLGEARAKPLLRM